MLVLFEARGGPERRMPENHVRIRDGDHQQHKLLARERAAGATTLSVVFHRIINSNFLEATAEPVRPLGAAVTPA